MPEHPLTQYLRCLQAIHAIGAGTPEESYYSCLENLLQEVGDDLRPRVLPVGQLAGVKSDYGLFTEEQVQEGEPRPNQLPSRGVIEAKAVDAELDQVISSAQVRRYLERYGKVLVTNFRAFAFVENVSADGSEVLPVERERFALAQTPEEFWLLAAQPSSNGKELGDRFVEFLQRVLRYGAPLTDPKDLAWFLASYARAALALIQEAPLSLLDELRSSLEEALDVRFQDQRGERFFRSTIVQTLFYGLFSAWVLWHREQQDSGDQEDFTWHGAGLHLRVPVMQALFDRVAMPGRIQKLGLRPLLDRATRTLASVDRNAFFQRFQEEAAIQYFYEPFLEAFDPKLRDELGVWYTPEEVVNYMVERVDTVLREELEIPDGLADPRVVVLDPACGTGAYLVAVLRRIAKTLQEQGVGDMGGVRLKEAARSRVFGFEILTASFVVAHLQIGLFLREVGVPLAADERASVYLTNALTGWQESEQKQLPIPELADERDAASHVKLEERVLVVMGNPPYYGYAGVAVAEERDLTEAYRRTEQGPKPKGQGLNDPYVRFYRMAERTIVERNPGYGIVCYITNSSWLDGMSHPGMRERFLNVFDQIWVDDLHGDKYRTGKLTPAGKPDPSIFSTKHNREGIQVGTAVGLLVRRPDHGQDTAEVQHRDVWGRTKLHQLKEHLKEVEYQPIEPALELGLPLVPRQVGQDYFQWPRLPDLFAFSSPGIKTSRDAALVDIDRDRLEERMKRYFSPHVADAEIRREMPALMTTTARFDAQATRKTLLREGFHEDQIRRYVYRPMDLRWLYWEPTTSLLDRERADYVDQHFEGNTAIVTTGRTRKTKVEPPLFVSALTDLNILDSGARIFPFWLKNEPVGALPLGQANAANTTEQARKYLQDLELTEDRAELLFFHAMAALHSSAYRTAHAGALRQDWPRVPLPQGPHILENSADLGQRVAALLDPPKSVPGVTTGSIQPSLRLLGTPNSAQKRPLDPGRGDFSLTAGWGYGGRGGIVMPGRGRAEIRERTPEEVEALPEGGETHLGERTYDIYLNDAAYWRNVPQAVWEYTLGGYPVIKKWLSYRENALLGRDLTADEVGYVQEMVRRIAALLLMAEELDASYLAVVENVVPWTAV